MILWRRGTDQHAKPYFRSSAQFNEGIGKIKRLGGYLNIDERMHKYTAILSARKYHVDSALNDHSLKHHLVKSSTLLKGEM